MHFRGRARNAVRRERTCCSCNTKDDTADPFSRRPMCGVEAFSPTIVFPRLARRLALRVAFGSSTFLLFRRPATVRRTAPIMQTWRRIRSVFFLRLHARKTAARRPPLITEDTSHESKFSVGFPKNGNVTREILLHSRYPRTSEIVVSAKRCVIQ